MKARFFLIIFGLGIGDVSTAFAGGYALECNMTMHTPIFTRDGLTNVFSKYTARVVVEFLGGGQVMWTVYIDQNASASKGRVDVSESSYIVHLGYNDSGGDDITINRQNGHLSSVSKSSVLGYSEGTCHPITITPKM